MHGTFEGQSLKHPSTLSLGAFRIVSTVVAKNPCRQLFFEGHVGLQGRGTCHVLIPLQLSEQRSYLLRRHAQRVRQSKLL